MKMQNKNKEPFCLRSNVQPQQPLEARHQRNGDWEVDITEFDITESDVTFFQEIDITESDVTKNGN